MTGSEPKGIAMRLRHSGILPGSELVAPAERQAVEQQAVRSAEPPAVAPSSSAASAAAALPAS